MDWKEKGTKLKRKMFCVAKCKENMKLEINEGGGAYPQWIHLKKCSRSTKIHITHGTKRKCGSEDHTLHPHTEIEI